MNNGAEKGTRESPARPYRLVLLVSSLLRKWWYLNKIDLICQDMIMIRKCQKNYSLIITLDMHICSHFSNWEEQYVNMLFSAMSEGRRRGGNKRDGGKQYNLLQMLLMMKVGEIILESALQHCQQLLVSFWSSCYRQNFPFYYEVKPGLLLSEDLQFL